MAAPAPSHATHLLLAFSSGDREALNELIPLIYEELRALAGRVLGRGGPPPVLGTTTLVHEAYLKLIDQTQASWQHRAQFLGVAARAMRCIIVDQVRRQGAVKRGGLLERIPLDAAGAALARSAVDVVALDDALQRLAEFDPRQARIVELRFFGGLSVEEAAEVEGVSPATVKREWTLAKAWLHRELTAS